MKTVRFKDVIVGKYIVRVEGYKVESAKVTKTEKVDKEKIRLFLKTTETKKKITLVVDKDCTMVGLLLNERYYADFNLIEGLRDGITIGVEYARKLMNASFNSVIPYFTVAGRPADDTEEFKTIMERDREEM